MRSTFIALLIPLLTFSACTPQVVPQLLPTDCQARHSQQELLQANWLLQNKIWRLRQSVLLEIGPKKIPLEGFLRLDTKRQEARLLAMGDMGMVLFDLQITLEDHHLFRAIDQLKSEKYFAKAVADSLRLIFLKPLPTLNDSLQNQESRQHLLRQDKEDQIHFIFDCPGDMRQKQIHTTSGDWRIDYEQYRQPTGLTRVPERIILNDFKHAVQLTLWIHEVKQENE